MKRKQIGLSLIELMIAIVLGIFVTGGVIQIFVSTKQTYRIQENLTRLQENGRFALNFIEQDLRIADYWGCAATSDFVESSLKSGTVFDDFSETVTGTNDQDINGSDSITVIGALYSDKYVVGMATESADIEVSSSAGLTQNQILLISDCSAGDIFQITNAPGTSNKLEHKTPAGSSNETQYLSKIYDTKAQVYEMASVKYWIANSVGEPSLFRSINGSSGDALIEGIENMQIQYGLDTDDDFSPNYYTDYDTTFTEDQLNQIVSLRISIVAVTLENNLASAPVPYVVFGTSTTPPATDLRIRRVFTSTIALRNRLP